MTVHWGSLLAVFAVSLSAAVAVVFLVTMGLLGLSARTLRVEQPGARVRFSRHTGMVVAAACIGAASAIVLLGLWAIVAR
jgi:hypothetical protein